MKQENQKSRIYKIQTEEPKPKKKKNEKNRKRNTFMNFRVSETERALIEKRIALSGMTKAEFFIQSCLYQAILVRGNIRTFDKTKAEFFIQSCLYQAILVRGNIRTFDKIRERLSAIEIKLSDMEKNPELSKDDLLELRTILEMLAFVYKRER